MIEAMEITMKTCILKKGKEKPLENRHPWVFSGAIDQIDEDCQSGDLVRVLSADNDFLGVGYFNAASQITVRLLSFEDVPIDRLFLERRMDEAARLRELWFSDPAETNAYRLIHSEGDFLPGLIVDRYADFLVVQLLTAGMERFRSEIIDILSKRVPSRGIFEKSDTKERELEGLASRNERVFGEELPGLIEIRENGLRFLVDAKQGQKTGFFLDQRENRELVKSFSHGRKILNCFSYTGGFSVYAASGGALSAVSVDSSKPALEVAARNFALNGFQIPHGVISEDVFEYLRKVQSPFDLIILDPPAFCKSKPQIEKAARGYKDINLCAFKKLSKGGVLFTSSCSSFISPDLFQKIVFGAAKDAGRDVRILAKTSHPKDHPINIYHPEGEYLKGLLCHAA